MDLIKVAEEAFATGKEGTSPKFKSGDTVTVAYRVAVKKETTKPPAPHTDASLLYAMETRAATWTTRRCASR